MEGQWSQPQARRSQHGMSQGESYRQDRSAASFESHSPSQSQFQSQQLAVLHEEDEEEDEDMLHSQSDPSQKALHPNPAENSQGDRNTTQAPPSATPELLSPEDVLRRIERLAQLVVQALAEEKLPELTTVAAVASTDKDEDDDGSDDDEEEEVAASNTTHAAILRRRVVFHNLTQSRKFSSILLVLSFCHALLMAQRTTTTREVYYFYVTHFRSQKECEAAIVDATNLLRVPRSSLGLFASPKGWYCGCIQILRQGRVVLDGQALSSIQGAPVTQEWLKPSQRRDFAVDCRVHPPTVSASGGNDNASDTDNDSDDDDHDDENKAPRRAKCILVIEKEGVYNRLSEDRLYERYPCILVTGKGFPDLATRSLVHTLHHELDLPVYGIADCNPYGMLVLQTYQYGSLSRGVDGGSRYSVPIQWLGLRPSHVERLEGGRNPNNNTNNSDSRRDKNATLPPAVYQKLTELDEKRLDQLLGEDHRFHNAGANDDRYDELEIMQANGYKVELEALNWLGKCREKEWWCALQMCSWCGCFVPTIVCIHPRSSSIS